MWRAIGRGLTAFLRTPHVSRHLFSFFGLLGRFHPDYKSHKEDNKHILNILAHLLPKLLLAGVPIVIFVVAFNASGSGSPNSKIMTPFIVSLWTSNQVVNKWS